MAAVGSGANEPWSAFEIPSEMVFLPKEAVFEGRKMISIGWLKFLLPRKIFSLVKKMFPLPRLNNFLPRKMFSLPFPKFFLPREMVFLPRKIMDEPWLAANEVWFSN